MSKKGDTCNCLLKVVTNSFLSLTFPCAMGVRADEGALGTCGRALGIGDALGPRGSGQVARGEALRPWGGIGRLREEHWRCGQKGQESVWTSPSVS